MAPQMGMPFWYKPLQAQRVNSGALFQPPAADKEGILPAAMYEHCLIFGCRECFQTPEEFEANCIGEPIDEYDTSDDESWDEEARSQKICCEVATQTEPWAPPTADIQYPKRSK